MTIKACTLCHRRQPLTAFYVKREKGKRPKRTSRCRRCLIGVNKAYRKTARGRAVKRASDQRYRCTPAGRHSAERRARRYAKSAKARRRERRYRLAHPERCSGAQRRWRTGEKGRAWWFGYRQTPKYRADHLREARAYRSRHPDRFAARIAVQHAIRAGTLIRPTVCEKCGGTGEHGGACQCRTEIHGHHHLGYARQNWLRVEWLCHRCHTAADRKQAA